MSASSPRFSLVVTVVSDTSKPRSARSFAPSSTFTNVPSPRIGSFVSGRAPSIETCILTSERSSDSSPFLTAPAKTVAFVRTISSQPRSPVTCRARSKMSFRRS